MRTYRASELGSCIRAQAAIQLGYSPLPTPAWLQTAYDRGRISEAECLAAMGDDVHHNLPGTVLDDKYGIPQMFLEWSALPDTMFRIRLDGAVHRDIGEDPVLEIKSPALWADFERAIRTGTWADTPRTDRPAWQVSVYMAATGRECVLACWDEEHGVRTFTVETAPYTEDDIRARVAEIERWVGTGGIPPTCSQDDGQGCPVAYLHEQEERVVLDNPALAGWLRRHLAAQAETAALAEERKQFELPPGRYECDGVHVTVAVTKGRTTYDTKTAIADGVDLSAYVKTGKAGVRWDVGE